MARKIVTVEDPIEYQLRGINQIQVKPQIGLNFATLLRSILRQDPDVIMVGEIRDLETAQIAVQAALTGHLVLSTLHTNSAAATITRLRDMGLEDYLLTRGAARRAGAAAGAPAVHALPPGGRRPPEMVDRFDLDRARRRARRCSCGTPWAARNAATPAIAAGWRSPSSCARTPTSNALIFAGADHADDRARRGGRGHGHDVRSRHGAALAGTTTIEEVVRSIRAEA